MVKLGDITIREFIEYCDERNDQVEMGTRDDLCEGCELMILCNRLYNYGLAYDATKIIDQDVELYL